MTSEDEVNQGNTEGYPVPTWIRRGKLRWVWGLWEPLMFYRRSAHMAPYSPGNSQWAEEWYLRMHSEEMVAKLAGLGINCVSTHWYKGFGLLAEAEEMARAVQFTELCHRYHIRVLGYHQWATVCYETFLDEVPHAKDWIQRDAEGKLLLYGTSTYWRWLGCQQHEPYVDYLQQVVRKCLTEAQMDGIEWDGTVYKCHCELCQQRFREYLDRKYADADIATLFGIPHFRHVRIPAVESGRDPLYQELLEFRREFMTQRLREYNALIKGINPEAAQVTYDMAAAPAEPVDAIDILVDENHDFSFVQDGQLTTKSRGLKHGFALDRVVLSTAWLRAPSSKAEPVPEEFQTEAELAAFAAPVGGLRRPETAAEVKRDLAETAMYGGHMVTPTWATRPIGGKLAAFEQPELQAALKHYLDFFRRHEELFDARRSLANIAVLRSRGSVTYDFFNSYPCVMGMEQVCIQHQIPYDMLFSYQFPGLDRYEAVILAEQTCLSDDEIELLTRFVHHGGGLLITGRSGLFDERFRHRRSHPFQELFDEERVVFLPDNPERLSRPTRDHPPAYHDMQLPERAAEIADGILRAAGSRLPYQVTATPFVGTDAYVVASGDRVIHLLNYDNEHAAAEVEIQLGPDLCAATVRLISPDDEPEQREIILEDRLVRVGELRTYAALVLPPAPDTRDGATT